VSGNIFNIIGDITIGIPEKIIKGLNEYIDCALLGCYL
jgi:hypothetical protein